MKLALSVLLSGQIIQNVLIKEGNNKEVKKRFANNLHMSHRHVAWKPYSVNRDRDDPRRCQRIKHGLRV